ncbi:sensor histidine kinase [Nocardiopsis aegyptia]|uniref:Signal transduction histidine kinase n=1 Tax=Nocardiopsis aegyptia TaxID=220378 RepID=A0A7Z0EM20_9ACTN|nr:histidine kinase [Nocardiopsis aegyptia]NYJ34374.1 signal transduction histidine kinase [Nocardiopsis aegyptia]
MNGDRRAVRLVRLAWALAALAGAELVTALVAVLALGMTMGEVVSSYVLTNAVMGTGFAACGAVLAGQRGRNPIGWLFLAAGLAHLTSAAAVLLAVLGLDLGWPEWGVRALTTVFMAAWPWGIGMFLALALQLFPTGRPVTPRWRRLLVATVVLGIGFTMTMAAEPAPVPIGGTEVATYTGVPFYASVGPLWTVFNAGSLLGIAGALAGLVVRWRRGDERLRRQLLWLVLAGLAAVALNLPRWIVGEGPILLLLAVVLVPVAVTVAILRHQLLDIRLVVSRTALYLGLTLAVVAAYSVLVAASDALVRGASGVPVVAALLIALAFNPVRIRAQRWVDRLFYGSRGDPVGAVSQMSARLAADDLSGVLAGIAEALRLPFAALRHDGREVAAVGDRPESTHTVALAFRGARVGDLVVGHRYGERALSGADRNVLALLASPLAAALHASALSDELQASRERIIAAREEERRRLHRDLHDGLGPVLTGAGYKADAARNLVADAPERAGSLIAEVRTDLKAAVDDVRRIVYGLRPPALDELGLVGAVRRQCEALLIDVDLDAPPALPALPAAVEVAAYRIISEALTNAARHARADSVRVGIRVGTAVEVTVEDDGGSGDPWEPGVGLRSIRDRAAELGGSCRAGPGPNGGRVEAVLPLEVARP